MKKVRKFRIKLETLIDEHSTHMVGEVYPMLRVESHFWIWLYDKDDPDGFPYTVYQVEEVFDEEE